MSPKTGTKSAIRAIVSNLKESATTASPSPRKGRKAAKVEDVNNSEPIPSPIRSRTTKEVNNQTEENSANEADIAPIKRKINSVKSKLVTATKVNKPKTPAKRKATADNEEQEGEDEAKIKKRRKTKEEKEAEAMPLQSRTAVASLKKAMHIGAHVSGAGGWLIISISMRFTNDHLGVQNAINNAIHIGGNSFALFLKSQRKWTSPPLATEARDQFKAFCLEQKYDAGRHVLPHGSYLVNLAQPDDEKAEQAYSCFLDDLQRCEALGIKLYNFHPGNTGPHPRPDAIRRIAMQLNKAHKATSTVITVLENMAGAGNVIGSTWEDLRDIIALVEDKSRVGVCIDTCHAFAAGHDLRSPEAFKKTMENFSTIVGMSYLKALHLNDSKAPLSSNRDLHANIGTGFLGLRAFHNVVNFEPFQNLPMVLETPIDKKGADGKMIEDKNVWATEIKLLESLIGADPESEIFKTEENRLWEIGTDERKKIQGQVDKKKDLADKKQQKTLDSMFKSKSKKRKGPTKDENTSNSEEGCSH